MKETEDRRAGTDGRRGKGKGRKVLSILLSALAAFFIAILLCLQILLNESFLTRAVQRIACEYVEGEVSFSGIEASLFRNFPNLNVRIDSFSITYPHERFAPFDSPAPPAGFPAEAGRSPQGDTLASFDHFSLSLNCLSLVGGRIRLKKAELRKPRIFLRRYDNSSSNWDILRFGHTEDSSSFSIPPVSIGRVILKGKPLVTYSDFRDSLSGTVLMKEMSLSGRYSPRHGSPEKLAFVVDSMLVSGGLPSDSLAFGLDRFELRSTGKGCKAILDSKAYLALGEYGRVTLPLNLEAELFPDFRLNVHQASNIRATIASIDLEGEVFADLSGESPCFKAEASISRGRVADLLEMFSPLSEGLPILKTIRTDAVVSAECHLDGFNDRSSGLLPKFDARLTVPESFLGRQGAEKLCRVSLDAAVCTSGDGLRAEIKNLGLVADGFRMSLSGESENILEKDPLLNIDGRIHAVLDSIVKHLPDSLELSASGNLDGKIGGGFRLSELDPYNFSGLGLECELQSDGMDILDRRDSIAAHLGRTVASIGRGSDSKTRLSARVDSLFAEYGASTFIRGTGIHFFAHNADEDVEGVDSNHPLHGHLEIASAGMMDMDLNFIGLKGSESVFQITRRDVGGMRVPHLSLTSSNDRISIRSDVNRISADGLSFAVNARPAQHKAGTRRRASRAERDSVRQELNIQLGESVMQYYRNWDLDGTLDLGSCSIITPHFPLENRITELKGKFDNDRIDLSGLRIESGSSDISASGSVSGIRRVLTGRRGKLGMSFDLGSDFIDLNEIFLALSAGEKYRDSERPDLYTGENDSDYLTSIQEQAAKDSLQQSALIIPANVDARFSLNAATLKYSEMESSWFSSDIIMKDRCLQLTNALAMTNMGDVFLEGFYSSRSKEDLKAGFDFTLSNVTAEKVISLFPAVDSIMPMLQAFNGLLDCEIAATASIDPAMSIILPSISGIVKIDGKNLSLAGGESLNKLRKTLMFKDKDSCNIDNMSIRGIVRDNTLEVFPFILKVDRYTVAIDGTQSFDQNFKYHFSAIKSPIPMRFGVNLNGCFDDWKWKIGKARYKSTKIPLFDDEVDALRHNLMTAIHSIFDKGVEDALRRNEASQAAIESKKAEIEYANGETDELSGAEKTLWETLNNSLAGGGATGTRNPL
ncbi:MAG: hypothetical protein ACI399_07620 [Candidatus Cryptobacteroides sp.]